MSRNPDKSSARSPMWWAGFGVLISATAFAAKLAIALGTGSTAVLSDAMESSINLVTSAFAAWAVWLSTRPRDEDHPYGHGKVEYFSVALEAVLLAVAGIAIAVVAFPRLLSPTELTSPGLGAFFLALTGLTLWLSSTAMVRAGRSLESPSIEADGEHLRADAITSLVIVGGLLATTLTGLLWLDPLFGLLLAVWVLRSSWKLFREAIAGLMDEASDALLDEIADALESVRRPGWTAPHHVKVHRLGQTIHIDLHIVFPWYADLRAVHDDTLEIERVMRERFGERCETMVHMEPCTPTSCPVCDLHDCPERAAPFEGRIRWSGAQIRRPYRLRADAEASLPTSPLPSTSMTRRDEQEDTPRSKQDPPR